MRAAAAAALLPAAAHAAPPHILFVLADDLGWSDVGFRSGQQIKTPTIDALAADGRVLGQYYVQDVCSASRATMLTGRVPLHNTVNDWLKSGQAMALPLNETLMPQRLAAAGYATHGIGKWHVGFTKWAHTPTFRGFDSWYGFYSGGEDYFKHQAGGQYDFRSDVGRNCGADCSQVAWEAEGTYSTTLFAAEAVRLVLAHPPRTPLFIYLAFQAVHGPRQVPASYSNAYMATIKDGDRRTFAGMLTCLDEGLGNVTAALRGRDMLDDTLVIFSADNGGPVPSTPGGDYVGSRNYPLRGGKHSIWEGGTRVVAAVWAGERTGLIEPALRGTTDDRLMHACDWFPTLCAVAGAPCGDLPFDGVDQSAAMFRDAEAARSYVLYGQHDDAPNRWPAKPVYGKPFDDAIRDGDGWKLIQGWGGKNDDWPAPVNATETASFSAVAACSAPCCAVDGPADPPSAGCAVLRGVCFPDWHSGSDIRNFATNDTAECCAACRSETGCAAWTLNRGTPPTCYLKKNDNKHTEGADCTSGYASDTLPPTPVPAPPTPAPPALMLFNVLTDPGEHDEVSAQHPDIVARLSAQLDALRATQVTVDGGGTKADPACPKATWPTDPHVGAVLAPWC